MGSGRGGVPDALWPLALPSRGRRRHHGAGAALQGEAVRPCTHSPPCIWCRLRLCGYASLPARHGTTWRDDMITVMTVLAWYHSPRGLHCRRGHGIASASMSSPLRPPWPRQCPCCLPISMIRMYGLLGSQPDFPADWWDPVSADAKKLVVRVACGLPVALRRPVAKKRVIGAMPCLSLCLLEAHLLQFA